MGPGFRAVRLDVSKVSSLGESIVQWCCVAGSAEAVVSTLVSAVLYIGLYLSQKTLRKEQKPKNLTTILRRIEEGHFAWHFPKNCRTTAGLWFRGLGFRVQDTDLHMGTLYGSLKVK